MGIFFEGLSSLAALGVLVLGVYSLVSGPNRKRDRVQKHIQEFLTQEFPGKYKPLF